MTSNQQDPIFGVVERLTGPKKHRRPRKSAFGSAEIHRRFEEHVARAQDLFLQDDKDGAEREATLALRIHPTDHLFALLAVIAESKGQWDRASDFRLLQAFLANDAVLWEELLHEFLQDQLYYKSAVCLQRLSALETKDKARYRTLQLQLADLYIGLGEVKRAANILVPLWNGSRNRDFEVFALLSSLFFQLGRWNSLHRLIESSLKSAFRPSGLVDAEKKKRVDVSDAGPTAVAEASTGGESAVVSTTKRRTSKRVRFFGDDNDEDIRGANEEEEEQQKQRRRLETNPTSVAVSAPVPLLGSEEESEVDDFDFSNVGSGGDSGSSNIGGSGTLSSNLNAKSSEVVSLLYGDIIEIRTPTAKRNFLTLVNVHAELLNEEGKFLDTIRLLEFTAGFLQVPLLELPPDLLVRLGVAYAFMGGLEQQCREVFYHLVETCTMAEYGDVLYDAANALQQVGLHTEARMLFQTLRRYHEFRLSGCNDASGTGNAEKLDAEEMTEVRTVFAAALFAEAQCEASLGNMEVAHDAFRRVLGVDPTHLQARIALGRMYMYELKNSERAIAILTPREDEQPLERIQLGAELVRVFKRTEKYVEAIALGVSIFELLFSGDDDGDTESVAPGSLRRSTASLAMPTLSRATSAIIPPSAISELVNGPRLGKGTTSMGRLSHALSTSIKASSAVFRSVLARRGSTPLTTSVYGASAAASTAAGWAHADEEERLKNSSTIFRFNRTRKPIKERRLVLEKETADNTRSRLSDEAGKKTKEEEERLHAKRRKRMEEVTRRGASSFWRDKREDNDVKCDADKHVEEGGEMDRAPRGEEQQVKEEEVLDEHGLDDTLQSEEVDDGEIATGYELPSLEEISKQFGDPTMQTLFIQASSNYAAIESRHPWDLDAAGSPMGGEGEGGGGLVTVQPSYMRVTIRDALGVLGRAGFVELAVTVIDCYSAIGKFTEAREFAFLVLSRCPRSSTFRHVSVLERPLRWALLRAALASKESEDAYRVGIRLLHESKTEEEKDQVLELLFGVLNRVEDGNAIMLRLITDRNQVDSPMLLLLGNRYYLHRSYIRALNMYLGALQERPNDILVCFLVGLSYMLISHQKKIRARDACMVAGWHYFSRYQEMVRLVDERRLGEAVYNCARALQYFGLHHLAIPLYEQVAYEFSVPGQCTVALQRAARFNMYFTYRWRTGNTALAMTALQSR